MELKLDSSGEASNEPPKRRGRRPRKSINKERSVTPEVEDPKGIKTPITNEPKKRGRPPRKSNILKDTKRERSESSDKDDKFKSIAQIPKKRGRWSERSVVEEPKKRGRPPSIKKEATSENESEDENEVKSNKNKATVNEIPKRRGRSAKAVSESSDKPEESEASEESKKRGRLAKDKLKTESTIKSEKNEEVIKATRSRLKSKSASDSEEESESLEEEPRRRGRPAKNVVSETKNTIQEITKAADKKDKLALTSKSKDQRKIDESETCDSVDREDSPDLDSYINELAKSLEEPKKIIRPSEEKLKESNENAKKQSKSVKDKAHSESENKSEGPDEQLRKRGRPARDDINCESKDVKDETGQLSSNTDKAKQLIKDEPKRRGRPAKDKTLSESEKTEVAEELKRRGRSAKEKSVSDTDDKTEDTRKRSQLLKDNKSDKDDAGDIDDLIDELHAVAEGPKKRGRPPREKVLKSESEKQEIRTIETTPSEPKKRGRPPKPSKEDLMMEVEERMEEMFASLDQPKRRGRSAKNKSISDQEEKSEDLAEPKESGESSIKISKDDDEEHGNTVEKTTETIKGKDSVPCLKNQDLPVEEEPTEASEASKKSVSPTKISVDHDVKLQDNSIIEDEPKKRGRPAKNLSKDGQQEEESRKRKINHSSKDETVEEEKALSSKLEISNASATSSSPSQQEQSHLSPKLTKFNCEDCSEVFTSVSAFNSHRLTHRTKKSGE